MNRQATVTTSSRLRGNAADVWTHATSMGSINREMGPWLRMTYPRAAAGLSLDSAEVRLGEALFTSWILFLGIFPVERMQVTIMEIEPGKRFVEQSRVLFLRSWRHERSIAPGPEGCVITDQITVAPPIALFTPMMRWFLERFFRYRHRQLERLFGAAQSSMG